MTQFTETATPQICRHCQKGKVNRPRGLCWSCYYRPGVRELYPSTSKYAHRGVGNGNLTAPLPAEPTRAEPGSFEKIAILEERVRLKQALHNPDDLKIEPSACPVILRPVNAFTHRRPLRSSGPDENGHVLKTAE